MGSSACQFTLAIASTPFPPRHCERARRARQSQCLPSHPVITLHHHHLDCFVVRQRRTPRNDTGINLHARHREPDPFPSSLRASKASAAISSPTSTPCHCESAFFPRHCESIRPPQAEAKQSHRPPSHPTIGGSATIHPATHHRDCFVVRQRRTPRNDTKKTGRVYNPPQAGKPSHAAVTATRPGTRWTKCWRSLHRWQLCPHTASTRSLLHRLPICNGR